MDETEFKSTHTQLNDRPCAFGKAILSRCCGCSRAHKVLLAEREMISCLSPAAHLRCREALATLREKALFALRMTHLDEALPHGKEIKVECGGVLGLRAAFHGEAGPVEDLHALLEAAIDRYGTLAALPYSEIMQTVVAYQARRNRRPG